MLDQSTPTDAEMCALMYEEGRWFSFAPRTFKGEVVDGKRRIAAAARLGFDVPPAVECSSAIEVARWLALQRHFDRSLAWQRSKMGGRVPLRLPLEIAGELEAADRREARAVAQRRVRAANVKTWDRRAFALARVNALLGSVEERAFGATAEELRFALGDFVEVEHGGRQKRINSGRTAPPKKARPL